MEAVKISSKILIGKDFKNFRKNKQKWNVRSESFGHHEIDAMFLIFTHSDITMKK